MAEIHYGATLTDFLAAAGARFPQRPATYFAGHTLTYSELDAQVAAAAGALREMGVRPGDRVVTGQPLATLLTDAPEAVDRARAALEGAFTLGDSSDCRPIIVGHVD